MLKTFPGANDAEKLKSPALKTVIQEECLKLAAENKLNSLEKPKQFHLLVDPFSIENDILTPTMKLKRNVAKDKFKDEIEAMYKEGMFKASSGGVPPVTVAPTKAEPKAETQMVETKQQQDNVSKDTKE